MLSASRTGGALRGGAAAPLSSRPSCWKQAAPGSTVLKAAPNAWQLPSPPAAPLASLNNQGARSSPDPPSAPGDASGALALPPAPHLVFCMQEGHCTDKKSSLSPKKSAVASENLSILPPFLQLPSRHRLTGGTCLHRLRLLPRWHRQPWGRAGTGRAGKRAVSDPAKPRLQL